MKVHVFCFFLAFLLPLKCELFDAETSNGTEIYIVEEEEEEKTRPKSATKLEYLETGQCIFVKSEEGLYFFSSPGNFDKFEEFDISCENDGLLSIINGWELNGQFFPALNDSPVTSREDRFMEFCGAKKPEKPFSMSQNVGLIEFRIPAANQGFRVNVTFENNPRPCNAILQSPQGVYTIKNYGRKMNCSVYIMFPESIRIISSNVGVKLREDLQSNETTTVLPGLMSKCKDDGASDYFELIGGDGLDTDLMQVAKQFCGIDNRSGKHKVDIVCENTAIRMVSSGDYENSLTIAFESVTEIADTSLVCPAFNDLL